MLFPYCLNSTYYTMLSKKIYNLPFLMILACYFSNAIPCLFKTRVHDQKNGCKTLQQSRLSQTLSAASGMPLLKFLIFIQDFQQACIIRRAKSLRHLGIQQKKKKGKQYRRNLYFFGKIICAPTHRETYYTLPIVSPPLQQKPKTCLDSLLV